MNVCRWKYVTVKDNQVRKNLLWLLKSLQHQHDLRIKAAITSGKQWEKKERGEEIFFFFFFWIAREQLVTWSETNIDLMAHLYSPPPTHRLPSSSLPPRGSLHLYQETGSTLPLMVDKPSRPDLTQTRLLFIPSLPVPLTSTTAHFLLAGLNLSP